MGRQLKYASDRINELDHDHPDLIQIHHDAADLPEQFLRIGTAHDGGAGTTERGVAMAQAHDLLLRLLERGHIADSRNRDFVALVGKVPHPEIGGKDRTILAALRIIGKPFRHGARHFAIGAVPGRQITIAQRQQFVPAVTVQLARRRVGIEDAPIAVVQHQDGVADGGEHIAVLQFAGAQRRFDLLAPGNVLLDRYEMSDSPGFVTDRRD